MSRFDRRVSETRHICPYRHGVGVASTAQRVRDYIDAHPAIRDCLRKGIVNLSALARLIVDEQDLESEDAALIACRRYEVDGVGEGQEAAILDLLGRSRLDIRTRSAVLTVRPTWSAIEQLTEVTRDRSAGQAPVHLVRGSEALTVITDDVVADDLVDGLDDRDLIKQQRDLVEISVTSPETIEETPGLMAHLTTALADRGINIAEVLSCYRDTIFVIDKEEMTRTVEVLDRLLGS